MERISGHIILNLCILICINCFEGKAQDIWYGGTVRFKMSDRLKAEGEYQRRSPYIGDGSNLSYLQGGSRYLLTDAVGVKLYYRKVFSLKEKNRYSADFFYSPENDSCKVWFSTRLRYQKTVNNAEAFSKGNTKLRLSTNLTFNISKKALPYFGTEIFWIPGGTGDFETLRISAGLMTKLSEKFTLNTFYKTDYFFDAFNDSFSHYMGAMLIYNIRLNKERKGLDEETENN